MKNTTVFFLFVMVLFLFSTRNVQAATPVVTAKLNSAETSCTIQITDYKIPSDGQKLMVAVWSANGGQNDLKWRDLSQNASGYSCSFSVSEHADSGKYYVHAYLLSKNGSMTFLKDSSFTVKAAQAEAVTVSELDQAAGTCTVKVTGVTSPSGVSSVKVPVWSKSNQSDIIWYSALKQTDGSWTVNVDFSKHGGTAGTYHIHAYAVSKNKTTDFVGNTKTVYSPEED